MLKRVRQELTKGMLLMPRNQQHIEIAKDWRTNIINELYQAELATRMSTNQVPVTVVEDTASEYSASRPTCLLDELREAWFQYKRAIDSLSIRVASSEVAIGMVTQEQTETDWLSSVNTFENSLTDGILILNSDGADLKFVTRDFSSSKDIVDIFLQHFLACAGLPEQFLLGKNSSGTGFSDATQMNTFFLDASAETLASKWCEFVPQLMDYYTFSSLEDW
ncbi:MAG: hypothetical protein ACRCZ9_08095 [Fusobacteriaceae bacterium]